MSKWLALFGALRKGAILLDPGKWKTGQVVSTALVAVLMAVYNFGLAGGWIPDGLQDLVGNIGTGLGVLAFGAYNIYTTVATTEKIGLKAKPGGGADSSSDGMRSPKRQASMGKVSSESRGSRDTGENRPRGAFLDSDLG